MTNVDARTSRRRLPARVITIADVLTDMKVLDHNPVLIVIDATVATDLPVPVLARLVRLRRLIRVAGGEVALAAGEPIRQVLHRTGLLSAIPYFQSVKDALDSLDATTPLPPSNAEIATPPAQRAHD